MPHYGILHDYKFENIEEVRGAEVYGVNDEKLGIVDDVIFDHSTGEIHYVVVDTGGWLSSKKFLVPLNRIQPYGAREDRFYAELDKERIQMLPEFNAEALKSESTWTEYEKRYQERWNEGTVMYNKDTGRIVTPPVEQVQGGRTKPLSEEDKRSLMRDFTPAKMGKEDDLLGVASGGHDVTLNPQKPSIAGGEDVRLQQQSVARDMQAAGSAEGDSPAPNQPPLQDPGVYILERVPEEGQKSDKNANYGRRWIDFQKRLHEGRDKVVGDCPLCGTHDKAA